MTLRPVPLDRWLPPKPRTFAAAAGWACLLAAVVGCGDRRVEFQRNELLHTVAGLTEQQSVAIDTALLSLFGTADEPRLPTDVPELASLVEEDRLRQAGGPVISHEPGVTQGLYRRHCARCHGVTGDGRGPVARHLSPLPRDFRRGLFKWKSTYGATPPTDEDLHAVLRRGVPGTSMPSFARLSDSELATLVDYVKHLAVRGQTERALVEFVAEELAIEESPDLRGPQRDAFLGDWLAPIARSWRAADERVVTAPTAPTSSDAVEAGRELYHSERAGCVKCHGAAGQGGAVAGVDYPLDYDRWTRDLVEASAVADAETLLKPELPIRATTPRRLVGATPHGGDSFPTLYRAIHQGIAGTTMPAVGAIAPGGAGSLTDGEVAQLAAYVATLMDTTPDDDPSTPSTGSPEAVAAR